MSLRSSDQGFDDFRRERKRLKAKLGPQPSALQYENNTLRELEQVEAKEVRERQLSREVHDFFAAATKQAASIVEKVARDAKEQASQQIENEMESFLIDALERMNGLVGTLHEQKRGQLAETRMEPTVANLVGAQLDEFRWAGTAQLNDKHIGQDPFETDVEAARREMLGANADHNPASADPIEEHLVAAAQAPEVAQAAAPAVPAAAPAAPAGPSPADELERFKEALKSLVRQGTMTRDEARAAWQTRLQTLRQPASR